MHTVALHEPTAPSTHSVTRDVSRVTRHAPSVLPSYLIPNLRVLVSIPPLRGYLLFVAANACVLCLSIIVMAFAWRIARGVGYAVAASSAAVGGAGTYVCWEPHLLLPSHKLMFAWAFLMYIPVSLYTGCTFG